MDLNTVDHLLTTTRSVRKRLDTTRPVEPKVIEQCIEIAIQAPTGANRRGWHFMVVTDPDKRRKIAELYKKSFDTYIRPQQSEQMNPVLSSSMYLAETMQDVPVFIICCIEGRPKNPAPLTQASLYGSILPAAWSLMLALRARGLGSCWTTLHLRYESEVAELLGMPESITQAVLLPVAYFKGEDFKPAKRVPGAEQTYWNTWRARR
jgi:nitroreductase